MYTIEYYEHESKSSTPAGAIKAAKKLVSVYGAGGKPPVICCRTIAAADAVRVAQRETQTDYPVRSGSEY